MRRAESSNPADRTTEVMQKFAGATGAIEEVFTVPFLKARIWAPNCAPV